MAKPHSIPPFPSDIDRAAFGSWLSGFTDGEGSFCLCWNKKQNKMPLPGCRFVIQLRNDDRPILELIRSYFGCGWLHMQKNHHWHPACRYDVEGAESHAQILIPHFDAFPLRAKKRHDYIIWKKAALLLWEVKQRPRIPIRKSTPGVLRRGSISKWHAEELALFENYRQLLIEQRRYGSEPLPTKTAPPVRQERGLFDDP